MVISQLSGAVAWLVASFVVISSAQQWPLCQDISQYERGGCCLVGPGYEDLACPFPRGHGFLLPRQACTTDYECSTPTCAGGGRFSVCEEGTCVCKSPTDGSGGNPPATCSAAADCSLPDCTGDGKAVVCEGGACICKTGDQTTPPATCSEAAECSLPDCVGDGKTVACENSACICKTADPDNPPPQGCAAAAECSLPDCIGEGQTVSCEEGQCVCKTADSNDPPLPQACAAAAECVLPDCTGDGKTIACEGGTCTCNSQDDNPVPEICSADAECTSLPDCEGDSKTKVCRGGECICETGDEAVITTTLTALPPGASLQTITDIITDNMVTTTTSEGSSDPTVVPIIVPIGKPPVICWGCVPLPANIQIKVPEFCVNILGFKIGNCPSDDNNNDDDDNDDDDDDDEDDEDDDDDDEDDEDCVLTVTCTQGCIVQAQTDPAAPQTTITCESRSESIPCETPEPTQCEPTSTATTTTTTTTPAITGICDSASCGDGSCPISKRGAVSKKNKRLAKRAQPPEDDSEILVDDFGAPGNLDDAGRARWFVFARALIDKYSAGNGGDNVGGVATSKMWDLDGLDRPFITGAGPSWGCTTVIVYSKLGIYLAHLWEREQFFNAGGFDGAKNFIRNGDPANGQPSLAEAAQRYFTNQASFVRAFVFTPRANWVRVFDDGSIIPEPQGGGRSTTNPWYKVQVDELMGLIRDLVPSATVMPLTYELEPNHQLLAGQLGQQEKTLAVIHYSPRHEVQMGNSCEQFRSLRIIYPLKQEWGPSSWKQGPVVLTKHKRAEDECPASAAPPSDAEEFFDENGEPLDPNDIEGDPDGTTPPPKTCDTSADCSSPNCAGGGRSSACEEGVCVCKTPPAPPPPPKKCSSDSECSGPECTGGMVVSKCEDGACVCKSPEDPSICSTVDTCGYLDCADGEERACTDGKCQCQEKTCSNSDECGFLSCDEDEEKACEDSKCICKDKPPPFASGTCNSHIREYGSEYNFATSIQIFNGAGTEIGGYGEVNTEHSWGDTITIPGDKLPYEMKYEFLDEWLGSMDKRDRPPPGSFGPNPSRYQAYSVRITAGETTWTTEDEDDNREMLPRCEVGGWDTHGTWDPNEIISDFIDALMGESGELPTRDMDCRWAC